MATHDYVIANASGAAVRQDINNALAAIVSNNSSATEPGTTYAFQLWFDTTNNILKIRNAANSAWIDWITTTATALLPDGTVGAPSLTFASETDTGLYRIAANTLGIATSGTERVEISDTGIIINEGGDDADVRIEGDSDANLVFIDAGNDRVGIGTASPGALLDLGTSTPVLRFSDTDTTGYHQIQSSNANFIINADPSNETASSAISFKVDNSEAARIDSDGNFGIGTTSPDALLNLESTTSASLRIKNTQNSTPSVPHIELLNNNNEGLDIKVNRSGVDSRALFIADTAISVETGGSERLRADSSGRVLIGTSSAATESQAQYGLLRTVGNTAGSTSYGIISAGRGAAASSGLSTGFTMGTVSYTHLTLPTILRV